MMKRRLNLVEYSSKMDLMILAMFAAGEYMNFSLNYWIGYIRPQMATARLDFHAEMKSKIPREAFADILG
jgi:hypothetical protein